MLFLLNPKYYHNAIWSNTSVLYDKHFQCVFGSMMVTRNYFQVFLWFYENDNIVRSGHF